MALFSTTRLSSLKKENRREPFTLHFSFKSTFTAPSTFPTFGRSVGQLALTTLLLSNHERCISRQNDKDAFITTTTLEKRKKKSFVYTVTNRVMDVSSASYAHTHMRVNASSQPRRIRKKRRKKRKWLDDGCLSRGPTSHQQHYSFWTRIQQNIYKRRSRS